MNGQLQNPWLVLLCIGVFVAGCQAERDATKASSVSERVSSSEPSWSEQVANVLRGESSSIRQFDTPVSSREFQQIANLKGLRELVLDEGVVNDSDIENYLVGFQLEHLRLRKSPLSDSSGLLLASRQLELRILNIPSAQWTYSSIKEIAKLPKLSHLRIGGSSIDDACVEAIASSKSLRALHLIGPRLTARSLAWISEMESLQSFYLDDCELPSAAWEALFRARPKLHVHIDQAHHDRDPGKHAHDGPHRPEP